MCPVCRPDVIPVDGLERTPVLEVGSTLPRQGNVPTGDPDLFRLHSQADPESSSDTY